jgi:hypothetical protein
MVDQHAFFVFMVPNGLLDALRVLGGRFMLGPVSLSLELLVRQHLLELKRHRVPTLERQLLGNLQLLLLVVEDLVLHLLRLGEDSCTCGSALLLVVHFFMVVCLLGKLASLRVLVANDVGSELPLVRRVLVRGLLNGCNMLVVGDVQPADGGVLVQEAAVL